MNKEALKFALKELAKGQGVANAARATARAFREEGGVLVIGPELERRLLVEAMNLFPKFKGKEQGAVMAIAKKYKLPDFDKNKLFDMVEAASRMKLRAGVKKSDVIDTINQAIAQLQGKEVRAARPLTQGDFVAKLDEMDKLYAELYQKTTDLKLMFDSWNEVPNELKSVYDNLMKQQSALGKMKNNVYNARMKISRLR